MTAELVSAFLVVILKWLEVDDSVQHELLEECFAECLTHIVERMSVSSLTEHLVTVWIMIRRVQCVLRGIDLESTSNISYRSIGRMSREPRGFTSLVELDEPRLITFSRRKSGKGTDLVLSPLPTMHQGPCPWLELG